METYVDVGEKLIIIPDIHDNHQTAEEIIKDERPDKIIFLGDYFDQFYDTEAMIIDTAKWLKESLKHESRIHLIGNHDMSYAVNGNRILECTGYEKWKQKIINDIGIDWDKFHTHCFINKRFLVTHAGLTNQLIQKDAISDVLKLADLEYEHRNKIGTKGQLGFKMLAPGISRMGWEEYGGVTWCDLGEFEPIPNLSQIFGHSHRKTPTTMLDDGGTENYCIDTGLRHYAVFLNNKIEIKPHMLRGETYRIETMCDTMS